jgi:hypothetical protein
MTPKWAFRHLRRVLPFAAPVITLVTLLGMLLALIAQRGRPSNPFLFAALSVVYAIPLLIAIALAARVAASFVQTLYKIRTLGEAGSFLYRLLFGVWMFGPYLLVKEGKLVAGENSVLHRVGGPGYLVIYNDSAVVTERCGRLERVLSAHLPRPRNYPYLEPFEKVWEIVDLRPQQWTLPVKGMTREGIPVICEADIRFKIDDRPGDRGTPKPPTEDEPYPFTPEAVLKAATARWIREPDSKAPPMDWRGRVVVGFTEGILRNILAEYYLDWLLGPTGGEMEHPREVIRRRLEEALQQEALKVGARILSVQLGEIRVEDEQIPTQWIEAWRAEGESQAVATRVEGEAELLRMEAVRARAQAEMLITLIRELQAVAISDAELRAYLLAARLAETLRLMSYDPFTRAFLPPEAIRTLHRLQQLLSEERMLPG